MAEYREYRPSELLQPFIRCFWVHRNRTVLPASHLIVPDRTVELIITENKIGRLFADSEKPVVFQSHLAGLKTRPQHVYFEGASDLFGIRIEPFALGLFTQEKVAATVDACLDPVDVFGPPFRALEQRVLNASSDAERILLVELFLLKQLHAHTSRSESLSQKAIGIVARSDANIRLDALARTLSVSGKTIERHFFTALGVNPKRYLRLHRFVNAITWYRHNQPSKLSDVAYENGYFDQMHFVKDVKAFTGCVPKAFFSDWSNPESSIQAEMFFHNEEVTRPAVESAAGRLLHFFG